MEHKHFKSGDLILKQGDLGCNAYRVLKGSAEVFLNRGGERAVLGKIGSGEIFGEMGMIEDKPRSASVQALEETEVEILTPQMFNEMILREPAQLIPYLKSFFERLRRANERSTPFAISPPAIESFVAPSGAGAQPLPGTVKLVAKTDVLRQKLLKADLTIQKFPFRIGRWSENFQVDVFVSNDLLIRDETPYLVSRNHCAIEREGNNYYVLDRGSAFGTWVNNTCIGGVENQMVATLHRGENELRLGKGDSPYCFQVIV